MTERQIWIIKYIRKYTYEDQEMAMQRKSKKLNWIAIDIHTK